MVLKESNSRWAAQPDHAEMGHADAAPPADGCRLAHIIKYKKGGHGHGQHGQGEELAEHAGVQRNGLLAQMSATMMLDAFGAGCQF